MFYSNNDYMEDLYFYNQMPGNTYMNNPANTMMGNMNQGFIPQTMGMSGFNNFQNPNMMNMGNQNPYQNINSLYPSIYRIINPVISRVISNSNMQMLNEDTLNNMVDTVYNIVDGQIEQDISQNQTRTNQDISSNNNSTNQNQSNQNRTDNSSGRTNVSQTNSKNNKNDSLLRDIIKILILKELFSRNQSVRPCYQMPFYGMQNQMM